MDKKIAVNGIISSARDVFTKIGYFKSLKELNPSIEGEESRRYRGGIIGYSILEASIQYLVKKGDLMSSKSEFQYLSDDLYG